MTVQYAGVNGSVGAAHQGPQDTIGNGVDTAEAQLTEICPVTARIRSLGRSPAFYHDVPGFRPGHRRARYVAYGGPLAVGGAVLAASPSVIPAQTMSGARRRAPRVRAVPEAGTRSRLGQRGGGGWILAG
jgi:hypothetical protein